LTRAANAQKEFRACLEQTLQCLNPNLVAEELSEYALKKVGQEKGVAQESLSKVIADSANTEHRFCDPDDAATEERTYPKLLASLDSAKTDIWAECLFLDPIADIAALGPPDEQALFDESIEYSQLTEDVHALRISDARSGQGWILSLDGRWVRTRLELVSCGGELLVDPTEPGMSGSPILNDAG